MSSSQQPPRRRRRYLPPPRDTVTVALNHTNVQGVMTTTTPNSEITRRKPLHQMVKRQKTTTQIQFSTMSLGSFPRFSELPVEIQILIWSFASSPKGPLHLTDRFIGTIYVNNPNHQPLDMRFFRHKPYFIFHQFPQPPPFPFNKPAPRSSNVSLTRRNLMQTSRLARQIALETWIDDVKDIGIGSHKTASRIHVDMYPEGKQAIVEVLRGLIAYDNSEEMGEGASHSFIEEEKEDNGGGSGAIAKEKDSLISDCSKIGTGVSRSKKRRDGKRKLRSGTLAKQDGAKADETLSQAKSSEGENMMKIKHVPAAVARKHTRQKYSRERSLD